MQYEQLFYNHEKNKRKRKQSRQEKKNKTKIIRKECKRQSNNFKNDSLNNLYEKKKLPVKTKKS